MIDSRSILTDEDIHFVADLSRRAGRLAAEMRATIDVRHKTGPNDLVTCADIALSEMIVKELSARFPDDQLISEEAAPGEPTPNGRSWLIDPIDGTDNYVRNDTQYAVMIGLLVNGIAEFGSVYNPPNDYGYYGGIKFGVYKKYGQQPPNLVKRDYPGDLTKPVRLMMGWRDRKKNPWIKELPDIDWLESGSVGIKVAKVINDEADVFVHLAGKLKLWDTAGPVAVALGAGLEVGTMKEDELSFPLPEIVHGTVVIIGRPGSLEWTRRTLVAPVEH